MKAKTSAQKLCRDGSEAEKALSKQPALPEVTTKAAAVPKADQGPEAVAEAGPRKRRLRIPKLKAGEGVANLSAEDEAFIEEEKIQRELHGWSQEEVADKAGVKRGTVQNLEHKRRGVGLHVAAVIAAAFGQMVDFFIRRSK